MQRPAVLSPSRLAIMAGALAALVGLAPGGASVAGGPADLQLQLLQSGLNRPVAVRHAGDHTGRLFILEKPGRILIWSQVTGSLLATPFLDITPLVDSAGNEQGLLGIAFHPDYASNGLFYVNYTRDPGPGLDRTVIRRYQVSAADPNVADPASGLTLLEIEQDFSNHNGGNVLFGDDGYLYIGMGDGGSGEDPNDRAQTKTTLLGKMLRIDVDGALGAGDEPCALGPTGYGIPPDNPFQGATLGCDEIWSYGLRNPWRFSFDRDTGDLYIGDVGQYAIEEVDWRPVTSLGGENYGWSCMEGNSIVNYNPCDGAPLTPPIFTYSHAGGHCSITGGYVYRGPISSFRSTYITADYCSGRIWFGNGAPGSQTFSIWTGTLGTITSFGEDQIGNVYAVTDGANGGLYRFGLPAATGAGRVPDGSGGSTPLTVEPDGLGGLILGWDASCDVTDIDYAVYEGELGNFESHRPVLCSTGGATTATFTPSAFSTYYLVAPLNGTREGSHGRNSYGVERHTGTGTCRDQALSVCP